MHFTSFSTELSSDSNGQGKSSVFTDFSLSDVQTDKLTTSIKSKENSIGKYCNDYFYFTAIQQKHA